MTRLYAVLALCAILLLLPITIAAEPQLPPMPPADGAPVDITPRAELATPMTTWDFAEDTNGWVMQNACSLGAEDGVLVVESTGDDPYFHRMTNLPGGPVRVTMRVRTTTRGGGQIFWTTDTQPGRDERKSVRFPLPKIGEWGEASGRFFADGGTITNLRFDPGVTAGRCEIDWIRVDRLTPSPLTIERVDVFPEHVTLNVVNTADVPIRTGDAAKERTLAPGEKAEIDRPLRKQSALETVAFDLSQCAEGLPDFPPIRRVVTVHHEDIEIDGPILCLGEGSITVARDLPLVRVYREDKLAAFIVPAAGADGTPVPLRVVDGDVSAAAPTVEADRCPLPDGIRLRGEGITVDLAPQGEDLRVIIKTDENSPAVEGPIVRVVGDLQQGLLSGVEHLGRGERSSSKLDVETADHIRYSPNPMDLTAPLMALRTDRATVAMSWRDTDLQPLFATPNFIDRTADHRMGLRGKEIDTLIRISGESLDDAILWGIERLGGLPDLPTPPRTTDEQWDLSLFALRNPPLTSDAGWGHAVWGNAEKDSAKRPFADMASTIWRLTGEVPELPEGAAEYAFGGSHWPNSSIYFVTGSADRWLTISRGRARNLLRSQQPDGSWRYDGEFRRGHFENTASGICGLHARTLLDFAAMTGDKESLDAGLRALAYCERFQTPRGAQTWEMPLHTPDLLASAYLVTAHVRAYELTGRREHLDQARKWAIRGLPFIYLWSKDDLPVMAYATTPVLGATHWRAPNWIGLPVQWVGGVYACSLAQLAPHDRSFNWEKVSRGILISAEQQMYPDGERKGLLPDSFVLASQQRRPADINPCAIVALRLMLDGKPATLAVASDDQHTVVAPFPVRVRDGMAHVDGREGVTYQIVIDGERIVTVESQGRDVVPLEGP